MPAFNLGAAAAVEAKLSLAEIANLDAINDPAEIKRIGEAFEKLSAYCYARQQAMIFRLAGYIATAQDQEVACELLYAQLPDCCKWRPGDAAERAAAS
jgi:hypothetical protein